MTTASRIEPTESVKRPPPYIRLCLLIGAICVAGSVATAQDEGKNKLRREIQDKIALYFRGPKLVDIMFTEFVIQL